MPFVQPTFKKTAFNCPYCNAFSHMDWNLLYYKYPGGPQNYTQMLICHCAHCKQPSYWQTDDDNSYAATTGKMVTPNINTISMPHFDMPDSVKIDYEEARQVCSLSVRSSAALLRLAVQKLCKELGEKGENINADIKSLVAKGLPVEIQQALDIIRVVGNNAVHPGQLSSDDVAEVAHSLFDLINVIVEDRIAKPKKLQELFEKLPQGARDGIERRDNSHTPE